MTKCLNPKTDVQKDNVYQRLPTACSLCMTALEECATRMAAAKSYKLWVGERLLPFAYMLARQMGAITQEHPFAPYVNVLKHPHLEPNEWFIEGDANEAWGSEGI